MSMMRTFILALAFHGALARRSGRVTLHKEASTVKAETEEMLSAKATIRSMVGKMFNKRKEGGSQEPSIDDVVQASTKKMSIDEAVNELDKRVPQDVANLVHSETKTATGDASTKKAGKILNNLVYQSYLQLDELMLQCKEFEERNHGLWEQVVADLARLGAQLSAMNAVRVSRSQCMTTYKMHYEEVMTQWQKIQAEYWSLHAKLSVELTTRRSDLAVFEFILSITQCAGSGGKFLLQTGSNQSSSQAGAAHAQGVRMCKTPSGMQLNFGNKTLQADLEKRMTPEARLALRAALGQVQEQSFLQLGSKEDSTTVGNFDEGTDYVEESPDEDNWVKCTDVEGGGDSCGKIYHTMSIEWGRFRDSVDELAWEMEWHWQQFQMQEVSINEQISTITEAKGRCTTELAEAISMVNADTEEMNEKEEERIQLDHEYYRRMDSCHAKISLILHEEICSVLVVRNWIFVKGKLTIPQDCLQGPWMSKTGECMKNGFAITCDDTCHPDDPDSCGGMESLVREVIVPPTTGSEPHGVKCLPDETYAKCGQRKCPVNCVMSEWSAWSACSRECGGGTRVKTRSILTSPKNGGQGCNNAEDSEECGTGSCDVNCVLGAWTEWSGCTQACDSGVKTTHRPVLVPIKGMGTCPKEKSEMRFRDAQCNQQACAGDELCVAQQDLVIAIDSSGSLGTEGFETFKNFAVKLVKKYKSTYLGVEAVKMGVVLFGNGFLKKAADGSVEISPALATQPLTDDFAQVEKAIKGAKWQKGFTNMAQAFDMAQHLLGRGGRSRAQSAVVVLTYGKPSFRFQTKERAQALRDANVKIYMAPVAEFDSPELDELVSWGDAHVYIQGKDTLKTNEELYVQKLVVKFCPDLSSPALMWQMEDRNAYMLIHEDGHPDGDCAALKFVGEYDSPQGCADAARAADWAAFAYGKSQWTVGRCWIAKMKLDQAYWDKVHKNGDRDSPKCIGDSGEKAWAWNPWFDTYMVEPKAKAKK